LDLGNFIKNLASLAKRGGIVSVKSTQVGRLPDDDRIFRSLRSWMSTTEEVVDPYSKSVWVFASVNAIAQNISRTPFVFYQEQPDGTTETIEDGPMYDLFTNPNPYMTSSVLFQGTTVFLELYGEAFWVFEGRNNVTEIPTAIWCVSPKKFKPHLVEEKDGNKKWYGSWDYESGNEKLTFAPHEILQFKYFNPYDEIRGLSPIEASRLGVEQDYFASQFNKNFFRDGAAIGGIIEVEDALSEPAFNRMRTQFEDRHQGVAKAHRVAILEGGAQWKDSGVSQKDMEFINLKSVTRGEILAAFKTNEVVLGNYENMKSYQGIKSAHKTFWEETLVPKMKQIEEFLWAKFFTKIYPKRDFWGAFDLGTIQSLRDDYSIKADMATKLSEIGFPINEINQRLDMGFSELPWGNTWWIKFGTTDVMTALSTVSSTQQLPDVSDDEDTPGGAGKDDDVDANSDTGKGKEVLDLTKRDDALAARYLAREIPLENMLRSKINRFFYEQRKEVIQRLYSSNSTEGLFDEKTHADKLLKMLIPISSLSSATALELLADEVNVEEVGKISKQISENVDIRVQKSVNMIVGTLKHQIFDVLTKADEEKLTTNEIADRIRAIYNKASNRSGTIARTEVNQIVNYTRFLKMQEVGITHHRWLSKGEKGRVSHKDLNGMIRKLGESFSTEYTLRYPCDDKAPPHEIINCLCITVPAVINK
jgi:HK97 family phage portal protein